MGRVRRENQAVTHRQHVIESPGWPRAQKQSGLSRRRVRQVGSRSNSARCNPHKGSVGYVPRSKAVPHGANEWMWRARRRETRADRRKVLTKFRRHSPTMRCEIIPPQKCSPPSGCLSPVPVGVPRVLLSWAYNITGAPVPGVHVVAFRLSTHHRSRSAACLHLASADTVY